MEQNKPVYRVVIYGAGGVGKNCLKYRLITGDYLPEYDPYWGDEWLPYDLQVDGSPEKIKLLRVNHDSEFQHINNLNLQDADGFIVAYSFKDRSTFEMLSKVKEEIATIKGQKDFPVVIIETKVDLGEDVREVHPNEAKELAAKWNSAVFSTSTKENRVVIEPFQQLVRQMKKFNLELERLDMERKVQAEKELKKAKNGKSEIPKSEIALSSTGTSFLADMRTLFNNQSLSDLTLMVQQKPLYLHKAILFARQSDFKNQIKSEDSVIDLGDSLSYLSAEKAFKYLYTGRFEGSSEVFETECKKLLERLDIVHLRPILKQESLRDFSPAFDRSAMTNTADVTIVIKEKKQNREISCHMVILCARSEYFRTMYKGSFKETQCKIIEVDDCSYQAFLTLIDYYYTDKISIEDPTIVCDLLK
jgi:GTPase SAR1 family protein